MIFLVKKTIKRAIASARSVILKPPDGVSILMYHSVGGKPSDHRLAIRVPLPNFLAQLDEINRLGYRTFTVSELMGSDVLSAGNRAIVLTFDDGYKDNITAAAPALQARGMKATFFVTTSNIDGKSTKKWSDGKSREYMDWNDVAKLCNMGFEIGSHMVDHVDLSTLSEDEVYFQLDNSKKCIAAKTGVEPMIFSYPYGGLNDTVIRMAIKTGYIAGCSSFKGLNDSKTERFILKRTEIDGYDIIQYFKHKIYGY